MLDATSAIAVRRASRSALRGIPTLLPFACLAPNEPAETFYKTFYKTFYENLPSWCGARVSWSPSSWSSPGLRDARSLFACR